MELLQKFQNAPVAVVAAPRNGILTNLAKSAILACLLLV